MPATGQMVHWENTRAVKINRAGRVHTSWRSEGLDRIMLAATFKAPSNRRALSDDINTARDGQERHLAAISINNFLMYNPS